ncbi:PQQ-dependent sugar dehydrogenase [Chondromyces crocatus]|uniref:PQQ-dependent sugar dehydrogenase n=1 Tax=Chondromyces crocatus TaxID=52 RepID=UPI001FE1BAA3|nr:sorbosone dehydrogenase family protein [Chondromyces crocatus]
MAACSSGGDDGPKGPSEPELEILTGADAMGDWTTDAPGVKRKITVDDLPEPYHTGFAFSFPAIAPRPEGAWPLVPPNFTVTEYATGFTQPRIVRVAPNGDVFVVDSNAGRVEILRDADGDGVAESRATYTDGLTRPFGLAFFPSGSDAPTHVYIANTGSIIRFPYQVGDTEPRGAAETLVSDIPSGEESVGGGGHWTRDLVFSKDNTRMFVSVGSRTNAADDDTEVRRANILAYSPDGKNEVIYASGIRNPVGLAIEPTTGDLWTAVNERDELGDDLVPDFVTRVREDGFYGWPWYYLGQFQDPRHEDLHPDLREKSIIPDVLVQSHSATLGLTFYTGTQFPADYSGDLFVAAHGSWNRSKRTGYKIIRIPIENGQAVGYYEDFMVGFVIDNNRVWGRPVGVAVAHDGALLVTDDGSGTVWHVAYKK